MHRFSDRLEPVSGLLAFAEGLGGTDSVDAVVDATRSVSRSLFDEPSVDLCEFDPATESVTTLGSTDSEAGASTRENEPLPPRVVRSVLADANARRIDGSAAEPPIEGWDPSRRAIVAPIDGSRVLFVGSTGSDSFDDGDLALATRLASALEPALDRLEPCDGAEVGKRRDPDASDAAALRRLYELTVGEGDVDTAVDRLLSLGREHFGLDTAILSRVEESTYTIEGLDDPTGAYEVGTTLEVEETMCAVTLASDGTEPLAFHDVADTEYTSHPASETVRAYIGAAVLVDGDVYGTVNFSSATPRDEPFRSGEQEFVGALARWIGAAIERRDRIEQLERYETIVEAVDDPVYALDTEGRFTFVNEAAEREFGYGSEVIGEHVSIGMDEADIERVGERMAALGTDETGSIREQFELQTADGERTIAETRLARLGDETVRGTAGVLRDVTEREERRRQLESFQQAIEEAADGVAILEDGEYVYVDETHVDMYGFDDRTDLLGKSWRKLYDDDEVERLEAEAFVALEEEGHWRGKVTGRQPGGTTFPAELSLTIVGDGRLVCTVRDETERLARERDLELKERAMNEASVAIQITDPTRDENPLVYVNDGFERITGYASEDVLGRNPRLLQGEQTDPEKIAQLREAIDAAEPVTLELENVRPDGTPYWARLSVTPVHDDHGELTNYIGIQQDVTDRRELAETLKERTERLEILLSATGTGIAEWDLGTDALTWDDTLVETFGRDPETVDELLDVVHPDDRERVRTEFDALVNTGEPWNGSFRVVTGSGDVRWLGTRAAPVYESGEPVAVLATGTDVTDRKERTRWLHRLFEHGPLLFAQTRVTDGEAVISDCNDSFVTRLGYDGDELIGTPLADLYDETSVAELRQGGYEGALDGELTVVERRLVTADGERIPCLLRAVPRDVDGRTVGTDALFIDISDRKESQEALERSRKRYRTLLRASPDPVFIADAETGEIVEVNAAAARIRGEPRAEILGRNQTELHPDGEAETYSSLFEEVAGNDTLITELPDGSRPELRTADGETIPVEVTFKTITLPDEPVVYGVFRDVSERLEQQASLRTSERRYRSLAENIPNGAVLTFTADLEYELAAGELLSELGLEPSDVSGAEVGTVLADGTHELVPRFRAALDGERTDRRIELAGKTLRIHISPIDSNRDDGTGPRGLVLGQDVTAEAQRERDLFEERERFRLLVDSVDEYAFFTLDEDGNVDTWNDGAAALFGYDAETALGMSIERLHPESDAATGVTERMLKQARVAGESAHEGWRVRADGSEFYADVRYAVIENDDGEFQGYCKVVRDMTERRRQRRRTERFVEESDDVVSILDTDGEFSYVSGSADRVLGYDPDELVGRNLFDLVHSDDQERAMESFFSTLDGDARQAQTELRLRSSDGQWLDVDARYRNKTDDDAIDGVLLYLRDVTDERERERRFEGIFNQTFQFTGLIEPDGTVLEVNDSTLEFAGVDRGDVIGRPLSDAPWWPHDESDSIDIADAVDIAAAGEFIRHEMEVNSADGLATIDFSIKPVTDEDGEVRLLVVEGRDITNQQRQRQHLEVMQRVIRHNMRNDLTKVRGWTELMSEEPDADERAEQFETVRRVLDKWEKMTEKMKKIRRLSERNQGSETSRADSLVDDAVAPVRERYPATNVTVDVSDHGELRVPSMLGEAVRELVSNAAEARDDATVTIELSRTAADWIEVAVRDDGPGLPEMEADVLETGEETVLSHGQGLGLWMVNMIVTQLGGEVAVESTTDGTDVCLRLPPQDTVD